MCDLVSGVVAVLFCLEEYWLHLFLSSFVLTIVNEIFLHDTSRSPADDCTPVIRKKKETIDASETDDIQHYVIKSTEELDCARQAEEAFLTIDLLNGDVVSYPATIMDPKEPGEVDIDINEYRPVIQGEDVEYAGCMCLLEALDMSAMVHLVYVLPNESMIAIKVQF